MRVSEFEYNRLKELARKYADGNVSLWTIYAALNAPRKIVDHKEIRKSSRRNKRRAIK